MPPSSVVSDGLRSSNDAFLALFPGKLDLVRL